MARSEEYLPLPRKQGRGYVGPGGERVTEWFVRKLRSSEAGYASPKEMTVFRKSPVFREIIEKTAKQSNVTQDEIALDRATVADFRKAFVKEGGGFRTWAEAERANPEAYGNLLRDTGDLSDQAYYLYFANRQPGEGRR
jgi:hypothetical protein